MDHQQQGLEALQDIKRIMERSSRFISLSGWSGIAAGLCALAGAGLAASRILHYDRSLADTYCSDCRIELAYELMLIAGGVLVAAVVLATLFTYMRSRKHELPMWNQSARRLLWNTLVPLVVGGIVILKLIERGDYLLTAPLCLVFYGLALINGSKYTLGEVKYLGYCELLLGLITLWVTGYGLVFWAIGFGVLHIIYGAVMWWKYERK